MSEAATTEQSAAPEAPAPETAEAPVAEARPKTAAEARQAIKEGRVERPTPARSVAEQVNAGERPTKPNRAGQQQPVDEGGRYASTEPEGATEAPEDDPDAPAEAAAEGAEETDAAEEKAATDDRIPLPEDHPLRDRGRQFFDELNRDEIRSLINTPLRRRELDEAQTELQNLRRQLAQERAKAEVYSDPSTDPLNDPEVRTAYEDIRQAYGDEAAQAYLRGQDKRGEVAQERAQEHERQASVQAAQQTFQRELLPRAGQLFEHWRTPGVPPEQDVAFQQRLRPLLDQYGQLVDQGAVQPDLGAFFDHFVTPTYLKDPAVLQKAKQMVEGQQSKTREQIEKEIRAEREEAERKALEEQAEARKRNPMGRVPGGAGQLRQAMSVGGGAKTAAEARQNLRNRARPGR